MYIFLIWWAYWHTRSLPMSKLFDLYVLVQFRHFYKGMYSCISGQRSVNCQPMLKYHIFFKVSLLITLCWLTCPIPACLCEADRFEQTPKTAKVPFHSHQNQNIAHNMPFKLWQTPYCHRFDTDLRYRYPDIHFWMFLCGWTISTIWQNSNVCCMASTQVPPQMHIWCFCAGVNKSRTIVSANVTLRRETVQCMCTYL